MITPIVVLLLAVRLLLLGVSTVVLLAIRLRVEASLVEASVVATIDDDNFGLLLHRHVRHVGLSSSSSRLGHCNADTSQQEDDADPHEAVPESPGLNIAASVVVVVVTVESLSIASSVVLA